MLATVLAVDVTNSTLADDSEVTIIDLLLATNANTVDGYLYDLDGDTDDSLPWGYWARPPNDCGLVANQMDRVYRCHRRIAERLMSVRS